MYLYELAIELNQRSSDLARAATAMGLGEVAPASQLDPSQVAALRAHFNGAPPAAGGAPWAPPPPASPAPPPPPPAAAMAPPAHAVAPPAAAMAPVAAMTPPPPSGPAPQAPFASTLPPPPAPPGPGAPGSASWPPPPSPVAAGAPLPAGRRGGLGTGQIAVLAVVGVLVVGLFGWMVTNTGPSEEQKERIEASKKATEPDEDAGVLGGGLGADGIDDGAGPTAPDGDDPAPTTPETTAPSTSGPDPFVPVDRAAFCDGAASVVAFELRFSAPLVEQDRDALVEVLDSESGSWETAVDKMRSGAPPDNHNDIDDYRDGYRELFGIVRSTSTIEEAFVTMGESRLSETVMAGQRLTDQIEFTCS